MAYEAISDIIDDVEDAADRFAAAHGAVLTLVRTGQATRRDLQGLAATAAGLRKQTREIRRELDVTDAVDLLDVEDGARVIGAWSWQRSLRLQLIRAVQGLQTLSTQVEELTDGREQRTVVVRAGETLPSIAQRELGDWRSWRKLLEANPDVSAATLAAGTTLRIPQ